MAVGDWHEFEDGYRFRETILGPIVPRECVGCEGPSFATPECEMPRCGDCLVQFYDISVAEQANARRHPPRVPDIVGLKQRGRWVKGQWEYL